MDRRKFFEFSAALIGSTVLPVGCGGGSESGIDIELGTAATDLDVIEFSKNKFVETPATIYSVSHDTYGAIDLILSEVDDEYISPEAEQFSVVLTGPELPFLKEDNYQIYNDSLGYFELYLQPGESPVGEQRYRAIFSILKSAA